MTIFYVRIMHYTGIGKTTLVRAVCQKLQEEGSTLHLCGFFTEEVRGSGRSGRGPRIGFDVVTLAGERGTLARIERQDVLPYSTYMQPRFRVPKYLYLAPLAS